MAHAFRRRFASWALVLIVLQVALVFTAPLAARCAASSRSAAQPEHECCPAGSHPPGECPRHASKNASACRLACDAPHGVGLLVVTLGVLPPNDADGVTLSEASLAVAA